MSHANNLNRYYKYIFMLINNILTYFKVIVNRIKIISKNIMYYNFSLIISNSS